MKFYFFSIFIITLSYAGHAYAYIDPITGSIIFQALIAGFVGAVFIIKKYFNKIKTFLTGKKEEKPMKKSGTPDKDSSNENK
jgi:hypothetical protein